VKIAGVGDERTANNGEGGRRLTENSLAATKAFKRRMRVGEKRIARVTWRYGSGGKPRRTAWCIHCWRQGVAGVM